MAKTVRIVSTIRLKDGLRAHIDEDGGVTLSKRGRVISVGVDEVPQLAELLGSIKEKAEKEVNDG